MYRKLMIAMCAAVLLSLLGSGPTFASKGVPTWETAFDPGTYLTGTFHIVHSLEEFKGELFAVAGDPGWFGWDENSLQAGQIFHSPDGKNWTPASELGFGLGTTEDDCGPNYYDTAWDMTVFQEKIYVLPFETCYLRPGVILRSSDGQSWESVATTEEFGLTWTDEFGTFFNQFHKLGVFKGMLYASSDSWNPAAQLNTSYIYRSATGDPGTWERVIGFPEWGGPGSFHVFKGALYVASDGIWRFSDPDWIEVPEQIWRTYDGVNWEMVVGDGFGNPGTDGLGGFADYKGYLYVGVGTYEGGGGQIWRSKTGGIGSWEEVVADGFGNPLDDKIDGLVVYLGDLYAYTVNWTEGGRMFRTKDGKAWESINEPGWGTPTFFTTHQESDQVVFKDDLYVGVIGLKGVVLKLAHPDK